MRRNLKFETVAGILLSLCMGLRLGDASDNAYVLIGSCEEFNYIE